MHKIFGVLKILFKLCVFDVYFEFDSLYRPSTVRKTASFYAKKPGEGLGKGKGRGLRSF